MSLFVRSLRNRTSASPYAFHSLALALALGLGNAVSSKPRNVLLTSEVYSSRQKSKCAHMTHLQH
jgi:hypothetical protein